MWNDVVSIFNGVAGRMILGVLNLSSAHPVEVALMLAVLAAMVYAFWLEMVGIRLERTQSRQERPIRLRRS